MKTAEVMVKERPILFSAPMVRALLEGRKTQTRRKLKRQPIDGDALEIGMFAPTIVDRHGEEGPGKEGWGASSEYECIPCPYGKPGDRLWVRETFGVWRRTSFEYEEFEQGRDALCGMTLAEWKVERGPQELQFCYRADRDTTWFPSIHMPRWASRLTLEITEVRVQRLQEITTAEAISEGFESREDFAMFWKADEWNANPWVWALTFKVVA
jgi:hypothetical protein